MNHTVIITDPPKRSGKNSVPDGAICGNGDLSVILGNSKSGLRAYIAKCDVWLADERREGKGGVKPLGYVDIDIPEKLYKNYYAEQRMDSGELFCRFAGNDGFIEIKIFSCRGTRDIIFEISSDKDGLCTEPKLEVFNCDADEIKTFEQDDIKGVTRVFDNDNLRFPCKLTAAIKKFARGKYAFSTSTNFDADNFEEEVLKHLCDFDESDYIKEKEANALWWKSFYEKSSFELSDEQLELNWYASQYHLAICTGNEKFPPGIYGNFITVENPNWHGDYHLNYNYEAPFYAACSSNHVEMTDCYPAPLEDFIENGRKNAQKYLNCKGVYYPVGMGPKGLYSLFCPDSDKNKYEIMFLGQKSNAAYAAVISVMRWNSTRDKEYAKEHIYPFLKEVGEFWEDFLKLENGRYVIYDDAIHEVPYYMDSFSPALYRKHIHAKNSLLSLGLVRMVFKALIDISEETGIDADKNPKRQDILERLSDYPTFHKKFKKVFRYTEKGTSWRRGNGLCIQHIYPAGQIDLGSDRETLKTAKNTFFTNDRWFDGNATNSIFPCAARIGVEPSLILKKMRLNYKKFQLPNLLMNHGGGCLENCSLTAATLNEMALQSCGGIIRFFPVWDKSVDCRFKNLRADGAFLMSAEMRNGKITNIEIISEIGGKLTFQNPFERCIVTTPSGETEYMDEIIELLTDKSDKITIRQA